MFVHGDYSAIRYGMVPSLERSRQTQFEFHLVFVLNADRGHDGDRAVAANFWCGAQNGGRGGRKTY